MKKGCQENLVADPRDWPGFACAESLASGKPMKGYWLDGTSYGKKLHAEKVKKSPEPVRYFFSKSRAMARASPRRSSVSGSR